MSVLIGHDCIHANISHLPPGQAAGYTTGTPDIRWTDADWKAHAGAVRICQDATASDPTADVLDVERGAATSTEAPGWVHDARQEFDRASRPGQREPAVYTSASNVTPLVNSLTAGGVTSGVGLWVANWDLNNAQAVADVENAAGPFPIIAVQYSSGQFYDTDVFSTSWLHKVSVPAGSGSTPHKTVKGDTLGSLADSRHMDVFSWLALQRTLSLPQAEHLVRHSSPEVGSTWRSG